MNKFISKDSKAILGSNTAWKHIVQLICIAIYHQDPVTISLISPIEKNKTKNCMFYLPIILYYITDKLFFQFISLVVLHSRGKQKNNSTKLKEQSLSSGVPFLYFLDWIFLPHHWTEQVKIEFWVTEKSPTKAESKKFDFSLHWYYISCYGFLLPIASIKNNRRSICQEIDGYGWIQKGNTEIAN
jgi:hypothetical protein